MYLELPRVDRKESVIDFDYQATIEKRVSAYIQKNFSFAVFQVEEKARRLHIESRLIATVSWCQVCSHSPNWLGLHLPKEKIRESGLWLVNQLYKTPFDETP